MRCLLLAILFAVHSAGLAQDTGCEDKDGREQTLRKGVELHEAGNYQTAVKIYQTLLKDNPDDPVVLYEMAFSYMAMKDFDACIDAAQRSLKQVSPAQALAFNTLASCQDDAGRPKEALATFERAMGSFPGDPMLNFNYAVTLSRQGEPGRARGHLRTAIENAPRFPSPYRVYATLLQDEGNKAGALFMNLRLIMLEGRSPRAVDAAMEVMAAVRNSARKDEDGKTHLDLALPGTNDGAEGTEFDSLNLALGLAAIEAAEKAADGQTDADRAVAALQTFFLLGAELPESGIKSRFIWKHAADPVLNLGEQGVLKPFLYHVAALARTEGAEHWIRANEPEFNKLVDVLRKSGQ